MTELVLNENIHQKVIIETVLQAQNFVWIVTADIKDMHLKKGRHIVPFLAALNALVEAGVAIRLIHAKEPGPRFREDFDKYPSLVKSPLFERILCPRVHTKAIIVDGNFLFLGSANLTGAGLGAKHKDKRNFEAGIITDKKKQIHEMAQWIDSLYIGDECASCKRRQYCPDPIDTF